MGTAGREGAGVVDEAASGGVAKRQTVTVSFNSEDGEFGYQPREKVKALLDQAVAHFKIASNPHLLSLFTGSGVKLPDDSTLEAAKVQPEEVLYLRQSQVKGGDGTAA